MKGQTPSLYLALHDGDYIKYTRLGDLTDEELSLLLGVATYEQIRRVNAAAKERPPRVI